MKKTAVEFLREQYDNCPPYEANLLDSDFTKALEMEKEQMLKGNNMEKETLEEVARVSFNLGYDKGYDKGAECKAERMYSEEEVLELLKTYQSSYSYANNEIGLKKWFEDLKKK